MKRVSAENTATEREYQTTSCNIRGAFIIGGHAVAQLVEVLCYKPEGRGFDSRWCHRNFSLT
jgi:hypothetical protein